MYSRFLAVAFGLFALSLTSVAQADYPPAPCNTPLDSQPDTIIRCLEHNGKQRIYAEHVPSRFKGRAKRLPLVVGLHGGGGDGDHFEKGNLWYEMAEQGNFIGVYPYADGGVDGLWNWATSSEDADFIAKVVADAISRNPVERKRVYMVGHSAGALMAHSVLGQGYAHLFAAVVAYKGGFINSLQDPVTGACLDSSWMRPKGVTPIQIWRHVKENQWTGDTGCVKSRETQDLAARDFYRSHNRTTTPSGNVLPTPTRVNITSTNYYDVYRYKGGVATVEYVIDRNEAATNWQSGHNWHGSHTGQIWNYFKTKSRSDIR